MNTLYRERRQPLNNYGTYIYILLISIFCWLAGYSHSLGFPVYGSVTATPLWNAICLLLSNKILVYTIGFLLTVAGAFILYRINYVMVLIRERTLLPILFYILFISTNPDLFPLKSSTLSVFCLIFALYELFKGYHDELSMRNSFDIAIMLGLGSLLWVHTLLFVPIFWIGMYSFRSLNRRTFIASVAGLLTVYWFLLGWCVWQNDYTALQTPFERLFMVRMPNFESYRLIDFIAPLTTMFVAVIASVNIISHEFEDNLRSRLFLYFLILLAGWSLLLYFTHPQSSEEYLIIASAPMSILIAHLFTVVRSRMFFWLFHLFILILVAQYIIRLWNI